MRRGYTREEIKQVAGLNLLRVFREVEKVSAQLKRAKL
jgi:microsomal dipeptidase-like Zn-dependent dipeptidase